MLVVLLGLLAGLPALGGSGHSVGPAPSPVGANALHAAQHVTPLRSSGRAGLHPGGSGVSGGVSSHPASAGRMAASTGPKPCVVNNSTDGTIFLIEPPVPHACEWTLHTFNWLDPGATSITVATKTVEVIGPGTVYVQAGPTFQIYATLEVTGLASFYFANTSSLVDQGMLKVTSAASVFLNGTVPRMAGGGIDVEGGSLLGTNHTVSSVPEVGRLNLTGIGVSGRVVVNQTPLVEFMNVSTSNYTFLFLGSPSSIMHLNDVDTANATLTAFEADDAVLTGVTIGSTDRVVLGNSTVTTSDQVTVNSLRIVSKVTGDLTVAHGTVSGLNWSGAVSANLLNSTFSSGAASITSVSASWSATDGCRFDFPLVFGGVGVVHLQNSSAPSLVVTGRTHAYVYNWMRATTLSANNSAQIPAIQVLNQTSFVQVFRYLIIHVQEGRNLPPVGTSVTITPVSAPGTSTITPVLPPNGVLGVYLPTDNVTVGGDVYTGTYKVLARAVGMSNSTTITILSGGQSITLNLSPPPGAPSDWPLYEQLAEAGLLIVVVVTTVYLARVNRRRRRRNGEAQEGEAAETASQPS